MSTTPDQRPSAPLPESGRERVAPHLANGEVVLAWCAVDLDEQLQFNEGLMVLTDRRLLDPGTEGRGWREWSVNPSLKLTTTDRSGLGMMALTDADGRLAHWRYTIGRSSAVRRLAFRFDSVAKSIAIPVDVTPTCPSCGAELAAAGDLCEACAPALLGTVSTLFRLLNFARPRFKVILLGFILSIASSAATLVPTGVTISLIENVLIPFRAGLPTDWGLVPWYLGAALASSILAWLLSWACTFVLSWVSERISADLRNKTYKHLQTLSLEYFGGKRTGDLMSRIGSDTDRICNFLSVNLLDFGNNVILFFLTVAYMISWDPMLTLVTLAPFPMIAWLVQVVRVRLRNGFNRGYRAWGEMTSVLADTIPGIRVVKAFAQEQRETDRFQHANDHVVAMNDRVNRVWSFFGPMATLLTELGLLTVWGFGTWGVAHGQVKVGVMIGFATYMTGFYARLESMSRMVQATQRAASASQRVFEILDRAPSVAEPTKPVHPIGLKGGIELRNVGFRHGNRQILSGLNLIVKPGEMIGVVGPSGAGKSTLVNLVCRFYDVSDGAILVDGTDIRSFPISEYRRNIGIVLQEPFLFYGTIAENIAYGRPDASRSEIVTAARAARAHEFILKLADGYDTMVAERGQSLSGGERQRISIARALLIDPKILILDEATSAVDTETEREIQEALDNLVRGRTTIAIAHRLSTLRKADRIVVLERGKIVEVGDHLDLLSRNGVYTRLHQAQLELANGGTA